MKGTFVTIFFYFLALAYAATVPDSASKDTLEARDKPTKAIIPTQLPDGRHRFDLHDNDVYVGAVEEDAHEAEGFVVYGPKGDVIKMPEQHKRSGVYSRQLPIPPFLQKFADAIWRNGLRLLRILNCIPPDVLRTCSVQIGGCLDPGDPGSSIYSCLEVLKCGNGVIQQCIKDNP